MFRVIFTTDTKGKDATTAYIDADKFELKAEKGYRCFALYSGDTLKAAFSADKVTAIFEV